MQQHARTYQLTLQAHSTKHWPAPHPQLLCSLAVQHLDSRLGVEVVYRDYGTSCHLIDPSTGTIYWPALRSTLLDEFVLAHSLGWWAKALLIRNTGLLWIYSVAFELVELTFAVRTCSPF